MAKERFEAVLEPVSHGGQFVVVPAEVADAAGVRHGDRVRGEVNGVPYRSALMKYSGVFHLGVHKAALAEAGVGFGDRVEMTIGIDDEPLPGDEMPDDLARALERAGARATFDVLAPSHRREHVKHVLDAKKPETRARRVAKTVASLLPTAKRPR